MSMNEQRRLATAPLMCCSGCVGVTRSVGSGCRLILSGAGKCAGQHGTSSLDSLRHPAGIATTMALGRLAHYGIDLVMLSVILAGVKRTSGFGCAPSSLVLPWPREGRDGGCSD